MKGWKGSVIMGRTYREVLAEKLKDPDFKAEWEAQEPEFQLIKAMLDARTEQNLSQRQLSERTGENGNGDDCYGT